jgi:polyferredoxin
MGKPALRVSGALRVLLPFVAVLIATAGLSDLASQWWGGEAESVPERPDLEIHLDMTVAEFGAANNLPSPVLKQVFELTSKDGLQRRLGSFGLSEHEIRETANRIRVLAQEQSSKNWSKIRLKFGLWFLFLALVFFLVRIRRVRPTLRKILYATAVIVFGVWLGSDPSPMGTVKDALVLYGARGVIFRPRLIAMSVFLALVVVANKFICSWGCQLGTLQDLVLRLNRNRKDTSSALPRLKIPFVITNTIRLGFFVAMSVFAIVWATDIVEPVDPFKIFKPALLGVAGGVFVTTVLVAGLFVYRPWCHLFCPFGMVGWLFEKISLFRIRVDYETCIACEACSKACPSTVMEAILKRDRIIPDCFACGTCMNVCPTGSISFSVGRRAVPPEGKFKVRPSSRSQASERP